MTPRQIVLARESLLVQQSLYLRCAATCEPDEVAGFTEQAEACGAAIKLFEGLGHD